MYTYILPGLAGRERPLYAIVCILTLSAYVVQILCYCARIHFPLAAFRPPTRIHIHAHVHVRVNYVRMCVCVPFIPSYGLYCYVRCVFGKQRWCIVHVHTCVWFTVDALVNHF